MTATRRRLLKGMGGLAALTLAPSLPAAAEAAASPLHDGLWLLELGSNVLALNTAEGAVVVDSGSPHYAASLLSLLDDLSAMPASALFNTHFHEDQIGGNEALGKAGATIIAHEKTRLRLATDYYLPHEGHYHRALPKAAQPTQTFYAKGSMTIADRLLDYGYLLQAHTDGDAYVHFRDANVLAVGDVASPLRDPSLDWYAGGWLGGRVDAMDLLLAISDEETRFVPSYGAVMSRAEFQAERDMMSFLYDKTVARIRDGYSARDMLEEGFMDELPRKWDDPYKFLHDNYKGLWAHHNKLAPNIV